MIIVAADARYDWPPRSSMHDLLLVSGNLSAEGRIERFFTNCTKQAFHLIQYQKSIST